MTNLQTIVNSKKESKIFLHPFMPSLGIELALQEGVPLNIGDVKLTKKFLANNEESGYYKWCETYPPDYDDTITALNMFNLLNEPKRKQLNFDFSRSLQFKARPAFITNSMAALLITGKVPG